jgi:hypothetical protein
VDECQGQQAPPPSWVFLEAHWNQDQVAQNQSGTDLRAHVCDDTHERRPTGASRKDLHGIPMVRTLIEVASKMTSAAGICFFVWRLGQAPVQSERATFTYGVRGEDRAERIFAYELPWLGCWLRGANDCAERRVRGDVAAEGECFRGYLSFEGGAVIASTPVPDRGTNANFMARAQVRVTDRVAVVYWHWSNGHLGRMNPSVDALGLSVYIHGR